MPRQFGRYRELPTADEAYTEGFKSGKNWTWKDVPGGPWVTPVGSYKTDKDWVAFCEATAENNKAWLRGWHDGQER